MDSACNKTMVGEITLRELEKYFQKKFGLGTFRFKVSGESFKFGASEIVDVVEKCVIPIGDTGVFGGIGGLHHPGRRHTLAYSKRRLHCPWDFHRIWMPQGYALQDLSGGC